MFSPDSGLPGFSPLANIASLLFFHSSMSAGPAGPLASLFPTPHVAVAELLPLTTLLLIALEEEGSLG